MKNTKNVLKVNLIVFVVVFLFGIVGVYAITYFSSTNVIYDNGLSGMKSTNVQGAIDELYNVCVKVSNVNAVDKINDLLSSNSDELYKDDKGNIRYYGKNPNNYIVFNNELWRIIGVINGKIKIIRNSSMGNGVWNSSVLNNWNNAYLKSYFNEEYYNSIEKVYKNMISEEIYYLGGPTPSNVSTLTASGYYDVERSSTVYSGNSTSIKQYIGLMYPSDYGYAAGSSCLSTSLYNYNGSCKNSNYLYNLYSEGSEWLQTPYGTSNISALFVDNDGRVLSDRVADFYEFRPVLYLKSDTLITGGDGSPNNIFTLV